VQPQLKKPSWLSSESEDTSNHRVYSSTFDNRVAAPNVKAKSIRNTPNLTMKSITNKPSHEHKSAAKPLSPQKKPKKGKYLNYMDSSKKGRDPDRINIVPLNGFVPDLIQDFI